MPPITLTTRSFLQEYEKAMDAYRETIHKPLPKDTIQYPAAKIHASTEEASQAFKSLKSKNADTMERVMV